MPANRNRGGGSQLLLTCAQAVHLLAGTAEGGLASLRSRRQRIDSLHAYIALESSRIPRLARPIKRCTAAPFTTQE